MNEGARAYEFFVGVKELAAWVSYFDQFLRQFPVASREKVRQAMLDFFASEDPDVKRFLLSYLDAYFLLAASGLPSPALSQVVEASKGQVQFTVFVDTNFVYSILGLHENPSNEAANDLMELVQAVSDSARIFGLLSRRVLWRRLEQSIRFHKGKLGNIVYPPNIAVAAYAVEISGVYRTFFERIKASEHGISAEDYFGPYERNLARILEDKGVTLYPEEGFHKYEQTLEVIEDIEAQVKYEREKAAAWTTSQE